MSGDRTDRAELCCSHLKHAARRHHHLVPAPATARWDAGAMLVRVHFDELQSDSCTLTPQAILRSRKRDSDRTVDRALTILLHASGGESARRWRAPSVNAIAVCSARASKPLVTPWTPTQSAALAPSDWSSVSPPMRSVAPAPTPLHRVSGCALTEWS
jgi:hypothetical protein